MFRSALLGLLALLTGLHWPAPASAQQFRVYTQVKRITVDEQDNEHRELMARSVSLFYAGKVYDWIPVVGEVTIFEPAQERFIVIGTRQMLVTFVPFDEIMRRLDQARDETKSYALQLRERSQREATQIAEPLLFQLSPQFQKQFEPATKQLVLSSPRFTYSVECQSSDIPESADAYLNYADWGARLNHVLHPQSLYPEPRLQLNQALRVHHQIPSKVQLRVAFDKPLHLLAEHRSDWELLSDDRQSINHWELLLKNENLKEVSFREYQRAVVLSASKK